MYLKSIRIKNFRKIKDAQCAFNPGLNLVVGPNDSGKTAIIDAIRLTLKQLVDDYFRITTDDFYDQTLKITIDLVFSFDDCTDEAQRTVESSNFAEYLSYTDENNPELKIWYSVKGDEQDIKFPEMRVGPTKDVAVDMDPRCKEKLKVVYLRPLRDAENELKAKPGSRISKILSNHKDINKAKADLIKILETFKDTSELFFDEGNGKPVKDEIKRLLNLFDEQSATQKKDIKLGPTEKIDFLKALEKIALHYPELLHPGLGTLNMIFIAAELLHLNTKKNPQLILVEEIEAHLHPQRQLKIIKALQNESKKGIQMILTTHSPNLASAIEVERLNICYQGQYYSLAKGNTELSDKNYSYLGRFLDVTKANLFFAQGVLLVEGPTEQLLLPEFAKILDYDLTDYGISVISTNNLGFNHFVNIFKRKNSPYNEIPIGVITDPDKRSTIKINEYKNEIRNINNHVECFVGKQLYSDTALLADNKKKITFEKLIFAETTILKKMYIDVFNTLSDRHELATIDMNYETLYEKVESEKAPIAQELAQKLSTLQLNQKLLIKEELEENLQYIVEGIKFVVPTI